MLDRLIIRSHLGAYGVEFVADYGQALRATLDAPAVAICDRAVYALHEAGLSQVVPKSQVILLEAEESSKTLGGCEAVLRTLVERRFRRGHLLIAVGGGVVQDVVGFVATILYRGVEWIFVPTTLLAQADSCVGSKSSLNLGEAKNVLGTFYPPRAVIIDTRFLDTLSEDDVRSGIGEIMHFYVYADSPLRARLAAEYGELLRDRSRLRPHIVESLRIKQRVVELDEFDRGERHKFNYGHTFGHALEGATDYAIKHGLAVTAGMDLANFISRERGLLPPDVFDVLHRWLAPNFPVYDWSRLDLDRFIRLLGVDKKNEGEDLTCILAGGPGHLVVERIPLDQVLARQVARYFREVAPRTLPVPSP